MSSRLEQLTAQVLAEIESAGDEQALRQIEQTALARKGELMSLMRGIAELPPAERAGFGKAVNAARASLEQRLEQRREAFAGERVAAEVADERFDPSEPAMLPAVGHLHPITLVRREVEAIFMGLGFSVATGPEVETEEFNFDLLNIPRHHPARDLQDTMWLQSGQVMRTHTSPVQLRAMRAAGGVPPVRVIAPGRVFRNEQRDATHEHSFHQVEGLMVDEGVSVADLKGILATVLSRLFGGEVEVRLRPHYFPFVEPGFEMDMRRVDAGPDAEWLEALGCGMVHPEVLRNGGFDPERVSGFAFGMGLDRLAMMRHRIEDVRWMMSGDLRFLQQF
ncbi:MAG: phenylalanine--tRNA ligase subunit alpha [Planctomycetota bacterium]|nr:MAG: phenylalanine--tRNA ligase subunit alpha [Planctomycetota bacterium]